MTNLNCGRSTLAMRMNIHLLELEALISWHTDERDKSRIKANADEAEGHHSRLQDLYVLLNDWKHEIEVEAAFERQCGKRIT